MIDTEPEGVTAPEFAPTPDTPPDLVADPFLQPDSGSTPLPPPSARIEPVEPRRSSVMPMVLAGVLTAAIGFGLAWFLFREGGPLGGDRLEAAESRLSDLEDRVAAAASGQQALEARVAHSATSDTTDALSGRIDALDAASKDAETAREDILASIEDLRQRPPELDAAATAAYERELAAMRKSFDDELQRIRSESEQAVAARSEAVQASADAESLAALAAVEAAVDSGAAFQEPLDTLSGIDPELPVDPMRSYADGVPTLTSLQQDFPKAARTAINADLATQKGGGPISFFKAQLGLRSLAPTEGNSADAILSRAEAKLKEGDLRGAKAETDALSDPAKDAMSDWLGRAETRLAAKDALKALSDKVRN